MSTTVNKPLSSPAVSPLAAIALKLVGIITIVSFLLDFLNLILPPDFLNAQWVATLTTSLVDRGIIPFFGIALLLAGFWVDRSVGRAQQPGNLLADLRFWSCLLASILGVVFLLVPILHVINTQSATQQVIERFEQEATQASGQLEQRLAGSLNQRQAQLQALFQNDELLQQTIDSGQIEQAISSGQLPENVLDFRENPEALNETFGQQLEEGRQRIQTEVGTQLEESRGRARLNATKSSILVSISSLLLAIGYTIVGWVGLRRLVGAG